MSYPSSPVCRQITMSQTFAPNIEIRLCPLVHPNRDEEMNPTRLYLPDNYLSLEVRQVFEPYDTKLAKD